MQMIVACDICSNRNPNTFCISNVQMPLYLIPVLSSILSCTQIIPSYFLENKNRNKINTIPHPVLLLHPCKHNSWGYLIGSSLLLLPVYPYSFLLILVLYFIYRYMDTRSIIDCFYGNVSFGRHVAVLIYQQWIYVQVNLWIYVRAEN